jgi:hypothetical protein
VRETKRQAQCGSLSRQSHSLPSSTPHYQRKPNQMKTHPPVSSDPPSITTIRFSSSGEQHGTRTVFPFLLRASVALAIILSSAMLLNAACIYPPSGLISWWSADGNANDIFGGHPGVSSNGVTFVQGMVEQAFNFNGSNSFVQVADNPKLSPHAGPDGEMTIEAWVKIDRLPPGSGQARRVIVAKGTTNQWEFSLYVRSSGAAQFAMWRDLSTSDYANVSGGNLSVSNWHHVAGVISKGRSMSLYVDGALVALTTTFNGGTAHGASPLFIGKRGDGQNLDGAVDEVAIYDRALGPSEIAAIYNAGSIGKCKPTFPNAVIYFNDFESTNGIGPEWSRTNTSTTPIGNRRFLGRFGTTTNILTLTNLPVHTNLTVAFDLLVIDTWDGNDPVNGNGPDVWDLRIEGEAPLLHTTFENYDARRVQGYPGAYPGGVYPARTGALEVNTLGYTADAVYRLSFTFAHATNVLRLAFSSPRLQALSDESWGLDNVLVFADGPTVSLTSPLNGDAFITPTNLLLSADAFATMGSISYVQFLADNVLLGTVTNSPFRINWSDPPAGRHVLTARATDESGRVAVSSAIITVNGLFAEYFDNRGFSGSRVTKIDPTINISWGDGRPLSTFGGDDFTVRWTGELVPKYSQSYTCQVAGLDDGCRVWIDGRRIFDEWQDQSQLTQNAEPINLVAGQHYPIMVDFYEHTGAATITLKWSSASNPLEVIPASQLFPVLPGEGINRSPNIPLITTPIDNGYVVDPARDLPMSADFFSDADKGQRQIQTAAEWEIWTVAPSELVWRSSTINSAYFLTNRLSNGVFTNSYHDLPRLLLNTDYVLRTRHKDNSGATNEWGGWGDRYFNTRPPGITVQPVSKNAIAGDNVWFTVAATNGSPVISFQWRLNGTNVLNATNATLILTNVRPADAGSYSAIVSNPAGTIESLQAALTVDNGYTALAESHFDQSLEGWEFHDSGASTLPDFFGWRSSGGFPAGYLYYDEYMTGDGDTTYLVAPTNFLGNKSGAFGGVMEYDQKYHLAINTQPVNAVQMRGAGMLLVAGVPNAPGLEWTSFRVLLETNSWRVESANGRHPTEEEMLRVLASLSALWITVEYRSGDDRVGMDNVRLLAPICTSSTILVMRRSANDQAIIEWPTNACGFQLEFAERLSSLDWTTNGAPSILVSNGLNIITVETTHGTQFHRLRKQ